MPFFQIITDVNMSGCVRCLGFTTWYTWL